MDFWTTDNEGNILFDNCESPKQEPPKAHVIEEEMSPEETAYIEVLYKQWEAAQWPPEIEEDLFF